MNSSNVQCITITRKLHAEIVLIALLATLALLSCNKSSENSKTHETKKIMQELSLLVTDDFEGGNADKWIAYPLENWEITVEGQSKVLSLRKPGPERDIRSPQAYALLKDFDVTNFDFSGRIKCSQDPQILARDMVVVFHYQDSTHFYYVHFSKKSSDKHNIIGIVNGKDREKINHQPAGESEARLIDTLYHEFKVSYETKNNEIKAYLDDMETPILTAIDSTFTHGLVGVGSFDDTGSFDDIQLRGLEFSSK